MKTLVVPLTLAFGFFLALTIPVRAQSNLGKG